MSGIPLSRSSNYDLQMPGGGIQNVHDYIGIAYSAN
jgi:hypothetical protein